MVRRWLRISPWSVAGIAAALVVALPILSVLASATIDTRGVWSHLAQTRLMDYSVNTALLVTGVGAIVLAFGVSTAWLVAMHEFPGRRALAWGLLLPLAVPTYLSAYAYVDMLQFSGPVQTWLRELVDADPARWWFPPVRSLAGAGGIIGFALLPYVYIAARVAFHEQSASMLEASRTLGRGPWATFGRVALPLARPSIVAGLALVVMETVAEFGAVHHCAVDTFATGIYRTWIGLESRAAAAQLSALVLIAMLLFITLEIRARGRRLYHGSARRSARPRRHRLAPVPAAAALLWCLIPVTIGFVLPVGYLGLLAWRRGDEGGIERLLDLAGNTVTLGAIAACCAVVLGLVVVLSRRVSPGPLTSGSTLCARIGYAIPGPVVAIGVLTPLAWADHRINDAMNVMFGPGSGPGLLLTGSIVAVVLGYQTRFLAVTTALLGESLQRIHSSLDDAGRLLGRSASSTLARVHVPLMWRALAAACLLVFVDVAKELPVTLMLRPFDFDTLAVRVFHLASDERLEEAAVPALAIVAISWLPIMLLMRGARVAGLATQPPKAQR